MSGFIHGELGWSCVGVLEAPIPFIDSCDDCALEAWERQTTGGIKAGYMEPDLARLARETLPANAGGRLFCLNGAVMGLYAWY